MSKKVEFGDFQTPQSLALSVCKRLAELGFDPDVIIEPTCGIGSFVQAAASSFPSATICGYEINASYLEKLTCAISGTDYSDRIHLAQADFFCTDWSRVAGAHEGRLLILGNLPWVTSAVLGALGSGNLPEKTNFLQHKGFDAITGKANFDISEWMLLALIRALEGRSYDVAMLLKTATARKIISYVEQRGIGTSQVSIINIDAKQEFNASVDASLLTMHFTGSTSTTSLEYDVFSSITQQNPMRFGHRNGIMVGDLRRFDANANLMGDSPQKWRSGVKHDASPIMEFIRVDRGLVNGNDELVDIEERYLYPLMKGSDIGSNREWRKKYVLVTQTRTGEDTAHIERDAPKTWAYLQKHSQALDARGSTIYAKGARFAIFGIGDYAFRPWRIAICGLYKKLNFRLIGPMEGKPMMFDDTVYYVSFDSEKEARSALAAITGPEVTELYSSMIFWDEKRPIKSSVLNHVDWTRV